MQKIKTLLSCVGIYAMVLGGGSITALEDAIGKIPGRVLNIIIILCTGVLIAPPRTAATTFEMSIAPFTDKISLLAFSIIFFAIVFITTIRPTRFVDIIGKYLTPILVICTFILIIAGIVNPIGEIAPPLSSTVAQDGVIAGYQTMDILAVVGFGIVMLNTLRLKGYTDHKVQLTTAIGLAGATAYFFEKISNGKIKYQTWIVINILISASLCNLGLTSIINLAVPILTTICPPFMVTVILLLFRNHIKNNAIYKVCAFIGLIFGLYYTIQSYI